MYTYVSDECEWVVLHIKPQPSDQHLPLSVAELCPKINTRWNVYALFCTRVWVDARLYVNLPPMWSASAYGARTKCLQTVSNPQSYVWLWRLSKQSNQSSSARASVVVSVSKLYHWSFSRCNAARISSAYIVHCSWWRCRRAICVPAGKCVIRMRALPLTACELRKLHACFVLLAHYCSIKSSTFCSVVASPSWSLASSMRNRLERRPAVKLDTMLYSVY